MGTTYTGYQQFVSPGGFTPTGAASRGRFISGLQCDDGDLDDAAVLNALAMAALDSLQYLGWRVDGINVVDGVPDASASGNTALVVNYNSWLLKNGEWDFQGTTALVLGATTTATFASGHEWIGAVTIANGFTFTNLGTVTWAASGALLPAINVSVGGLRISGTQPGEGADPGANNMLYGTNIAKSWGTIVTDGAGGTIIEDGFNVTGATPASSPPTMAVTFARAMANANYSVSLEVDLPTSGAASGHPCIANLITADTATTGFTFKIWDLVGPAFSAPGFSDPTTQVLRVSFQVFARQA